MFPDIYTPSLCLSTAAMITGVERTTRNGVTEELSIAEPTDY